MQTLPIRLRVGSLDRPLSQLRSLSCITQNPRFENAGLRASHEVILRSHLNRRGGRPPAFERFNPFKCPPTIVGCPPTIASSL